MSNGPQKKQLPDGGWGWMVVLGVCAVNLCTRSIEQSFGLLFGDFLRELEIETTGAAIIISILDALINFSGLFVGPLSRVYSYRKVALVGALLCSIGLVTTYPATNMTHILITYSIINGLGVGLAFSATFVALNNYFIKKRGQAVGLSLAGMTLGMMLMPQAIKFLLEQYSFRGTIFIIGAFALNGLVGGALLQPAKWHYVDKIDEDSKNVCEEMATIKESEDDQFEMESLVNSNHNLNPVTGKTVEDIGKPPSGLIRKPTFPRNLSTLSFMGSRIRKSSVSSVVSFYSSLDFTGSGLQLHLENHSLSDDKTSRSLRRNMSYLDARRKTIDIAPEPINMQPGNKKNLWQKVVDFMDLDLLKDPIYLNLVFGLSICYVAEQNFQMVTPFFLNSIGLDNADTALFLTIQAFPDILARLTLPFICDRLTISKRSLFMGAIFLLGICRSVLAHQTDRTMVMVWIIIAGFFRGASLINFTLTVSEYSTLEKLPAAFGLHMVGKGIFIICLGPIIGIIRDTTLSYVICIHSQTVLIVICCIAWSIEYILLYMKNPKKELEVT